MVVIVGGDFVLDSGYPIIFKGFNYQVSDDLSWVKGRHSLKFGYELLKLHFYQQYIGPTLATFDGSRTGDPMADFMLGALGDSPGFQGDFGVITNDDHTAYNSFYAQDDYRVKPRLMLNYGLRYEPFLQWKDGEGNLNTIVPNVQSTVEPTALRAYCSRVIRASARASHLRIRATLHRGSALHGMYLGMEKQVFVAALEYFTTPSMPTSLRNKTRPTPDHSPITTATYPTLLRPREILPHPLL